MQRRFLICFTTQLHEAVCWHREGMAKIVSCSGWTSSQDRENTETL